MDSVIRDPASVLSRPSGIKAQIADFFAQRIAIKSQQFRRPQLIAPALRQSDAEKWPFNLIQNAVIKPRRGQSIFMRGEVIAQMAFDAGG
jgi:hypothetical protein